MNKQPENLYVLNYRESFGYFTSARGDLVVLKMNVILHVNEMIENAVVILNYSLIKVFPLHSATREPSLLERLRKPWKQLINARENSGFNRQKEPFEDPC